MLFCAKAIVASAIPAAVTSVTADTGKIRLGGACRLPVKTIDSGKIRLGGACRLPVKTTDSGKIRLGGACRLPVRAV